MKRVLRADARWLFPKLARAQGEEAQARVERSTIAGQEMGTQGTYQTPRARAAVGREHVGCEPGFRGGRRLGGRRPSGNLCRGKYTRDTWVAQPIR